KISVRSFNNAKKEMPKHFLKCDLVKTTPFDKEPLFDTNIFYCLKEKTELKFKLGLVNGKTSIG
ncbi:MAG: hypothetical protein E7E66_08740, partial [Enterococcus faecalis]|nr:hypothetical protein [Enterococcus faecalis]